MAITPSGGGLPPVPPSRWWQTMASIVLLLVGVTIVLSDIFVVGYEPPWWAGALVLMVAGSVLPPDAIKAVASMMPWAKKES